MVANCQPDGMPEFRLTASPSVGLTMKADWRAVARLKWPDRTARWQGGGIGRGQLYAAGLAPEAAAHLSDQTSTWMRRSILTANTEPLCATNNTLLLIILAQHRPLLARCCQWDMVPDPTLLTEKRKLATSRNSTGRYRG